MIRGPEFGDDEGRICAIDDVEITGEVFFEFGLHLARLAIVSLTSFLVQASQYRRGTGSAVNSP